MKKLFILFSLLATSTFAQDFKRTFKVSGFDKLEIGHAFNINVTEGNQFKVEVKGREKDVEEIVAKVSDGELYLGYPRNDNWKNRKDKKEIYVTIVMPKLVAVDFSGATNSKVSGFSSNTMKMSISGASSATFNIDAKDLKVDCSGASNLKLVGNGGTLNADISGASNINTYEFKVNSADIDASGASDAKVFVTEKLYADASGASSVKYKGSPSVKKNTSGAGSVRSAD